jgi:hypothetical protein
MLTDKTKLQKIEGQNWPWPIYTDGVDLWIFDGRATCFGGGDDPQDAGETASGISTAKHPDIIGCALPMAYHGANRSLLDALGGSPIPKIKWFERIEFHSENGVAVACQLIDIGPAKRTGNAIDLTLGAARLIDRRATARSFESKGNVRMVGCAKYLQPSLQLDLHSMRAVDLAGRRGV